MRGSEEKIFNDAFYSCSHFITVGVRGSAFTKEKTMNQQEKQLKEGKPLMWSEVRGHEVYVYRNGELVYKRWQDKNKKKTQPSLLWNAIIGWLNEWIS